MNTENQKKLRIYNQENFEKLTKNGTNCLCTIEKVKCMCDEFKNMKIGICHCEVFIKE